MATRKSYADYLSPFDVIWEREGVEIARARVMALDVDDARSYGIGLGGERGIDPLDVQIRAEEIDA